MLELQNEIGVLRPNSKFAPQLVIEYRNYQERPGQLCVSVTCVAFSAEGDILALGDKHGRVLVLHYFQDIVYVRYDAVADVRLFPLSRTDVQGVQTKKKGLQSLSRSTPVNGLCFLDSRSSSGLESLHYVDKMVSPERCLVVAVHVFLVVYSICTVTNTKSCIEVLRGHKLPIHSLFLCSSPSIKSSVVSQEVYFLSGSIDVVIVWSTKQWSPVFRLASSHKLYPRVVFPVCTLRNPVGIPPARTKSSDKLFRVDFDEAVEDYFVVCGVFYTNKVIVWDPHNDFQTVATLKEAHWKHALLSLSYSCRKHSSTKVVLDLVESSHRGLASSSSSWCPVLLGGHLAEATQCEKCEFCGFLLRWELDASISNPVKIVLIRGRPVQIRCLEASSLSTDTSTCRGVSTPAGFVSVLLDTGDLEIRSLVELDLVVKMLPKDSILPVELRCDSLSRTSNLVYYNVDDYSRKITLAFVDGTLKILNLQLFLNLHAQRKKRSLNERIQTKMPLLRRQNDKKRDENLKEDKQVDQWSQYNGDPDSPLMMSSAIFPFSSRTISASSTKFEDASVCSSSSGSFTSDWEALQNTHKKRNSQQAHTRISPPSTVPPPISSLAQSVGCASRVPASVSLFPHDMEKASLEKLLEQHMTAAMQNRKQYLSTPTAILLITKLVDTEVLTSAPLTLSPHPSRAYLRDTYLLQPPYRFPDNQRDRFWRLCLELPMCQKMFEAYLNATKVDGGFHPFYRNLEQRIPLRDPLVLRRLKKMLSYLAYWSPVLKQVEWMPQLVFGMVILFGNRPLFCFETLLSIILWWSYLGGLKMNSCKYVKKENIMDIAQNGPESEPNTKEYNDTSCVSKEDTEDDSSESLCYWGWFAHPLVGSAPLNLVILASHTFFREDQPLWCHVVLRWGLFGSPDIQKLLNKDADHTSTYPEEGRATYDLETVLDDVHVKLGTRVLWPLLRSWLSELLPKHHLETLWDHLFGSPEKPLLVVAAVIAVLLVNRETLLTFSSVEQYRHWMTLTHTLPIEVILQRMYNVEKRMKYVYLKEMISPEKQVVLDLEIPVTLHDAQWPPLGGCRVQNTKKKQNSLRRITNNPMLRETKEESERDVMYPQLPPWWVGQVGEIKHIPPCDSQLARCRGSLLSALSDKARATGYTPLTDASLLPVLNKLLATEQEDVRNAKWLEMGLREQKWDRSCCTSVTQSKIAQPPALAALSIQKKILEFYDMSLRRLNNSRHVASTGSVRMTEQNETQLENVSRTTRNILLDLTKDMGLLQSVNVKEQLERLNAERVAVRQRVLEEEAKSILHSFESGTVCSKETLTSHDIQSDERVSELINDAMSGVESLQTSVFHEKEETFNDKSIMSDIKNSAARPLEFHDDARLLVVGLRLGRKRYARRKTLLGTRYIKA